MIRKALLLYNPSAGRDHSRRESQVKAVLSELLAAGVEAVAEPTHSAGSAVAQTSEGVERGFDTVIACGGDGTVHEVLQGLVGTSTALGLIPLGTANSLAFDLGLPRHPVDAARALLGAYRRRIAVGRIEYQESKGQAQSRYFTVAAGIGPDALLAFQVTSPLKQRLGMAAYYAQGLRLWATHSYPEFEVEFGGRCERVSELLAVRVSKLGGMINHLAPGADLGHDSLRLVLFKTRSRMRYLHYVGNIMLTPLRAVPDIELADATEVQCRPLAPSEAIYAEADGEPLGTIPARLTILPDAITLLAPSHG